MTSRTKTLPELVRITCDTVAEVLDTYNDHNAELPYTTRPLVLGDVKKLHRTLEQYEKQIVKAGVLSLGATVYPQHSTQALLGDCGTLGKQLLIRINGKYFRDNTDTSRDIALLTQAVAKLLADQVDDEHDSNPPPHAPDAPDVPEAPVNQTPDNWNRRPRQNLADMEIANSFESVAAYNPSVDRASFDVEKLRSMLDALFRENHELREENQEIRHQLGIAEVNNQSKIHHIIRLHAAIKDLGMRHAMRHKFNTWEDLTDELPSMIERIESTNELLRDLEQNPKRPETSSYTRPRDESGIRSPPASPRDRESAKEVARRSPSPTDSNVSTVRESSSRLRRTHRADRKRIAAPERRTFWNF